MFPDRYLDGSCVLGGRRGSHEDKICLPKHQLDCSLGSGVGDGGAGLIEDVVREVVQYLVPVALQLGEVRVQ